MKNLPIPLLTFLAAQVGAAVWWGAQIDAKVKLVEENRRYIQEVVIPSYEISDNWDNPHYNNWLKAGGWKDHYRQLNIVPLVNCLEMVIMMV